MKDIQDHVGISCERFEEQFRALLIINGAGRFLSPKSASSKYQELKRLTCLINYDGQEGSVSRGRFRWLERPFETDEIFQVICGLAKNKTRGPDGFSGCGRYHSLLGCGRYFEGVSQILYFWEI